MKSHSKGCLPNGQAVSCAAPAALVLAQSCECYEVGYVAQCGVVGDLGEFRPFAGRELAFEPVQQPIDDRALPVIERLVAQPLPDVRLAQDLAEHVVGAKDRTVQTIGEPDQPVGHVEFALLAALQCVIIGITLPANLG